MSVKRYAAHTNIDDFKSDWHESKDGPMVRHDDYAALEARCAALAAENAGLNKFIKDDCFIYTSDDSEPRDAHDFKPGSLATDAFLAEVRAQGVEMFAEYIALYNSNSERHAHAFAAQLRKGVQS